MAKARLSMRKIKETLRLSYQCGLSRRLVAHSLNVSRSAVADYLYRAQQAGIGWPLPEDLTDQELEQSLFPPQQAVPSLAKPLPDFDYIYRELKAHKKFNLTLDLLWREYKEQYPEGYQYARFCELYRRWQKKLDFCLRQDHRGGEKLFVDYGQGRGSGMRIDLTIDCIRARTLFDPNCGTGLPRRCGQAEQWVRLLTF